MLASHSVGLEFILAALLRWWSLVVERLRVVLVLGLHLGCTYVPLRSLDLPAGKRLAVGA